MDLEKITTLATDLVMTYAPRLIGAILVWIIGRWVIKALTRAIGRILDKRETDETLKPFLKGLIKNLLLVMLVMSVLGMLGVQMTSFIAVLGAIGLAVGMALSGTLQNFAGGVIILLFKPFKVGDFIEAQGFTGNVHAIQIFNTILKTLDNKTVIIPNGGLSTGSLVNYSTEPLRRVDWTFGIAYGDSTDIAMDVLKQMIDADKRILHDPEPFLAVSGLGDSSVNLVVRAWVKSEDYWGVYFDMNKQVYQQFSKEGLNIPFPQMDVHLHQQ